MKQILEMSKVKGKSYDVCLMNAPYQGTLHIKFLDHVIGCSDIVCSVQPSMWLFGGNAKSTAKHNIDNIVSKLNRNGGSITSVDKTTFDANIPQELSIIYYDKGASTKILINGYGDAYTVDDVKNIKKYGNDRSLALLEDKLKHLAEIDNIYNHLIFGPRCHGHLGQKKNELRIVDNEDGNSIILALPTIRGNIGKDDFYTTIDPKNKVVRYKNFIDGKGHSTPWQYIKCPTVTYGNNILNYLKTDFCRICEYFVKLDTGLPTHALPWFDFSDPIFDGSPREIDDALFKKFNISDEIRKHIEEILPDYYNIRK